MDLHKLISMLADGEFHSGEEIGECLGVSRAAIWKQIKRIEELGLDVFKVTGKGYKLSAPIRLLDGDRIFDGLNSSASSWIRKLDVLTITDSTNQRALDLADTVAGKGYLCFAEYQSQGRGRRGRKWVSPLGSNLYFSMVKEFANGAAALEGLSLMVGLSIVNALKEFDIGGLSLKWPNDVILEGKKVAGILLEMTGDPSGLCQVVIGVGINVAKSKMMDEIDQAWISLGEVSNSSLDRNQLAISVVNSLVASLEKFEVEGFAAFRPGWSEYDALKGRSVSLATANNSINGDVVGVDDTGGLLLRTEGEIKCFKGGEITVRLES